MGAGKVFCILGGILTLAATYFFSWANIGGLAYSNIYSFFMNIGLIFQTGEVIWIILAIVFLIFAASGVLILIGVKSRVPAIIGAIFVIGVSVYILLVLFINFDMVTEAFYLATFGEALVPGIIPFDVPLHLQAGVNVSLGLYLLLGGGVLGLIGGIMGSDDF